MPPVACAVSFIFGAAASAGVLLAVKLAERKRKRTATQARFVAQPHPGWSPKQPQPCPYTESEQMDMVDPADYDKAAMYALTISFAVPRPIALVSSLSPDGVRNVAPYSYFNVFGHAPPYVVIGCCRGAARGGAAKDTYNNIVATGEFVVNYISEWFVEAANHTCGEYGADVDEFEVSGLTPIPSVKVAPPRVKESAVHLECKLRHVLPVTASDGRVTAELVVGEVVLVHIGKGVAGKSPSGKLVVDPLKFAPVARLGGITYGLCNSLFEMPRPNSQGFYPAQ